MKTSFRHPLAGWIILVSGFISTTAAFSWVPTRADLANAIAVNTPMASKDAGPSNQLANIAVDARWAKFAAYLKHLVDSVQMSWERTLIESKIAPPAQSEVTVTFVVNAEGNVARIVRVDNKSTEEASRLCVASITEGVQFGAWTDEMKESLGREQEMTFTFRFK